MSYANIYDHMLNAPKGWPSPWALDKAATMADPTDTIVKGTVMCLDATARLKRGLDCAAVPIVSYRNANEADVRVSTGNLTGGVIAGLVCTGPFEVETTEFDATQAYAPNDPLTAGADGVITRGTLYTDTILGMVSDGVYTGPYGKSFIKFWTYFLPPLVCPSSP